MFFRQNCFFLEILLFVMPKKALVTFNIVSLRPFFPLSVAVGIDEAQNNARRESLKIEKFSL
jgi:hypothetical protein